MSIEVRQRGLEIVATSEGNPDVLIGHIYREGDALRAELLDRFKDSEVAGLIMVRALRQTSLDDFGVVPAAEGSA